MSDLSDAQALKEAEELKNEFHSHELMRTRRGILSRKTKVNLKALGIPQKLQNIVPYQTEIPNQEARQYATALSLALPEVQVFTESEQTSKKRQQEKLEGFYAASLQQLAPDDFDVCRHMAQDGLGVRRLDEVEAFYDGTPEREDNEEADIFLGRVDEFRKDMGLPLRYVTVDPQTFYYVENLERDEVIFGVERLDVRESEVKKDGLFSEKGELIIVRTKESIRHWWQPADGKPGEHDEPVYEGPNRFGHTGYILYRGLYTGLTDIERRYDPFIMVSLNQAQHRNLFQTLLGNMAVVAVSHWLETDLSKGPERGSRAVATERKTKGRGAQVRTEHGAPAAEFEPGVHVKFRELSNDAKEQLARLDMEDERYRFRDVLMGEASADSSGRAIIRLQEAAGRQLAPGLRSRQLATQELLKIIRRTLFSREEYLGGEGVQRIFVAHLAEGLGEGADFNKTELISVEAGDNMPHEIKVVIENLTQAAALAWIEEGLKLEGTFSRDTIDQDFYRMKNIPRENRRRVKDEMRKAVIPAAVQQGADAALAELAKEPINRDALTLPAGGPGQGGARPGESGMADSVRPEDAAAMMRANA